MTREKEEDFSLEDDVEVQTTFGNAANSEYQRLISQLKYNARRERLLQLRSLGRVGRKRLQAKYAKPSAK